MEQTTEDFSFTTSDTDTNSLPMTTANQHQTEERTYENFPFLQMQTALAVVGIFSNATATIVFASKKMKKSHFNMLIMNQVSNIVIVSLLQFC